MKKLIVIGLIAIFAQGSIFAQGELYSLSASKLSSILRIASDSEGNLYIHGKFSGSLSIGNYNFNSTQGDYFLYKMSPSKEIIWAFQSKFWLIDMKTHNNKLFLLGQYNSNLSFKGVEKTFNKDNFFFACMTHDGELEWLSDGQSNGAIYGSSFDIDDSGNSYVLCSFKDSVKLEDKQLNLGGDKNAFLAKYNSAGKLEWVKHLTGGNSFITGIWAHTVCYDPKNNQILVGGEFAGDCKFDQIKIKTRKLVFGPKEILDGNEAFIAKYSPDGTSTVVKSVATETNLTKIRTDADGNIYLGGHFKGEVSATKTTNLIGISIFDGNQKIKTTTDPDMGPSEEGYIAKFNAQDQFQWITRCEGKSTDRIIDFVLDNAGNIYACGFAHYEVGFSGKTKKFPVQPIQGTGESLYKGDIFMVKINNMGEPEWFKMAGGIGNDMANSICQNANEIKISGLMSGSVIFDNQNYSLSGNYYQGVVLSLKK
jgi:hypothetical protein